MNIKQEAAEVLKAAGWTNEEIASVLTDNIVVSQDRQLLRELVSATRRDDNRNVSRTNNKP